MSNYAVSLEIRIIHVEEFRSLTLWSSIPALSYFFELIHDQINLFLYITVIWSFLSLPAEPNPRPKMTQCITVHENQIHDSNQLGKEQRAWNRESISGVSLNAETT